MSHTTARHLALMAALLSGLPAIASAQDDVNQDNTAYGTTAAEFLLFGAGARGAALGGAFAAIGMADFDRAFHLLSEAIDHRTNFVNLLAVEPFFDPLRKDSRFPKLLKRLHLPT